MSGALAAVLVAIVVCGSALVAWVLWLRSRPACSRKEYEALAATVDKFNERLQAMRLGRVG